MRTEVCAGPSGVVRTEIHDALPAGTQLPPGEPIELRAGSIAGLRQLRAGLTTHLEERGCDEETVLDAQLVLAEIATNAFVHDVAPYVLVLLWCDEQQITVATAHPGEVAPPAHPVAMRPAPDGVDELRGGRGLALVDRVVTERTAANIGGRTTTVVRMAR